MTSQSSLSFTSFVKNEINDYKALFSAIPSITVTLFCVSVVVMNLMASKAVISTPYLTATGGLLISWAPFLCMDVVSKHFGPKAATKLNIIGLLVNLACVALFEIVSLIQIDTTGAKADYSAFNSVYRCTWFVLVASSVAFVLSGVVNNFLNYGIGKLFKKNPDGKIAYMTRCYISTFVGQYVDNALFLALLYLVFLPSVANIHASSPLAVFGGALLGSIMELITEVIFSPLGYSVTLKWKANSVGKEYFLYCEQHKSA